MKVSRSTGKIPGPRAVQRLGIRSTTMSQDSSPIEQLLAFAANADRYLTQSSTLMQRELEQHVRDACSVARGYVDLVRLHNEPVNIDDLERVLVRIANGISDRSMQRRYLTRLRTVVAWSRMSVT